MILEFNILKLKFKLLLLRLTGKITRNIPTVKLNQQGHNSKEVLIIFPQDEPAFRVALYSFKKLLYSNSHCSYYFIIHNIYKESNKLTNSDIIFIDFNKNIINELSSNNRLNFLKKEFDIIVDLNTRFNYNCSELVSRVSSNLKIGFKSNFSDLFYNIQLDISSNNVIENAYKKINSMVIPI